MQLLLTSSQMARNDTATVEAHQVGLQGTHELAQALLSVMLAAIAEGHPNISAEEGLYQRLRIHGFV